MQSVFQKVLFETLEAIHRIDRASTPREIVAELHSGTEHYGVTASIITELPSPTIDDWQDCILANGLPTEWYVRYIAEKLYRHDPCAERCRMTVESFFWHELDQRTMSPSAKEVLVKAAEFGLSDGLCIPFHLPTSYPAAVALAGERFDPPPYACTFLHALAWHALHAALRLADPSKCGSVTGLSEREREILQWTASGKTAWEISRILGISCHTVNTHLRNVRQKYDTANNAHSIAEAIRRHDLQF
ncbi:autoinducer binding domain-containing protein [Labrys sp. La1]|uniref:autoinducer binding domain-containing protein n=1 Tax=Labrys sp. La1 TaxID=3404917 RepID=UPI003EB8538F